MSNTWGGTDIALIAQAGFEAFKAGLAPLSAYATDFSAEAQAKSSTVTTRVITKMSAGAFSSSYESGDTTTTAKTITLNQHSFRAFHSTDVEASKTNVNVALLQAREAGDSVARAVLQYVWGLFLAATYGDTASDKLTVAAANFDADAVADLAKLLDDADVIGDRSMFVSNAYMAALRTDNAIQNASASGSTETLREGAVGRLLGADVFRTNLLPSDITDENTVGWMSVPSAIAVAARPVVPQDTSALDFEIVSDAGGSGLSLGFRSWYNTATGIQWGSFESLYGATAVQTTGLKRIVSE
jgi:hypothetical protein